MQTIRAIFQDGNFKPLDPVNLPDNTHLTVALLQGDDLSADAIAKLAHQGIVTSGLKVDSLIRLDKLVTLTANMITRRLGLGSAARADVAIRLRLAFGL